MMEENRVSGADEKPAEAQAASRADAPGKAGPSLAELEGKYHRSRRWNVVLLVLVVFLGLVTAAQVVPGQVPGSPAQSEPSSPPESTEAPPADEPTAQETATQAYEELDFVRRDPADPMAIGDVDAPVVLTMWTDLRCPFCAVFSRETLPVLVEEYVDTGRVRIEFHDVAFFGEQSEDASVAAHAAGNQGKYMEFVTAIYDAAPERGHADLPRDVLIGFAEEAGVADMDQFVADLDDPALRTKAQEGTKSAQMLGVNSVPFFVAGNAAVSGAQPVGTFQSFLDQVLEQAE